MLNPRTANDVLSLAACLELSGNSRLGFATKVTAQQPGLLFGNLQSTLGMHVSLRESRGGSRIQTWNRYAYVANNPLNAIDPKGLFIQACFNPDGCSWGLGGGGYVDGIQQSFPSMLGGNGMTACPGVCNYNHWAANPNEPNGGHWQQQQFWAFANGSGYYAVSGPGALYYSVRQAGMAAVQNINGTSIAKNREYAGEVYEDQNGIYSYTYPTAGDVASSRVDPNGIPGGTMFVGDYHTHGANSFGVYDDEHFSPQDIFSSQSLYSSYPGFVGGFLGTPGGRIEFYSPATGYVNVLAGPPLP